jgi:hypothetical protein
VVTGGVGAGFGKALSLAAVCVHRNIKPRSDVVLHHLQNRSFYGPKCLDRNPWPN